LSGGAAAAHALLGAAVWGSGSSSVYTVANNGFVVHSTSDGTWTVQASAVWGSGNADSMPSSRVA
jgi:hypothetical protein